MKADRLSAKEWGERIILALLFVAVGSLIILVLSPWRPLLGRVSDYLGRIGLTALLLVATLWVRRSSRHQGHAQVLLGLLILAVAVSLDRVFGVYLIHDLGVTDSTPAGWALQKLNECAVVVCAIVLLTRTSGANLGSIYIQKGNLKLGLTIGWIAFFVAAAGSIPMANLFYGRDLTLARIVPWTPWLLVYALANGTMEELMFRGLFLRKLEPFLGKFIANFMIAFAFTALLALTACGGVNGTLPTATLPAVTPAPGPADGLSPLPEWCEADAPGVPPIALVGATLIDGTGADPLPDAALVIQDHCIVAVGPRAEVAIPGDAQVIELDGATILPGFFDTHVHNTYYNPSYLRTWAGQGVTTVRDLGARLGTPYFELRDQLATDPLNARIVSAGPLVTVPEGYPIVPNGFRSLAITSTEDARVQITALIDAGAEVIKITLVDGLPSLSPEEAAAIVQTAHERGIPVSVHATDSHNLQLALDAGVDDVAHMSMNPVSDETIRRMVSAGVYWVPTLEALDGEGADNLLRFVEAGGQVALGTDAGYLAGLEVGMSLDEITLMEAAGMTPMQVIVAATRNGARVCRLEDRLGTLEVGKLADVLVVDGDPLGDLGALANVRLVIHSGVIIRYEAEP